jgi:hypothetical protein
MEPWKFCAALNGNRTISGNAAQCSLCGKIFAKVDPPFPPPAGEHPDTLCPEGYTKKERMGT